jgi:hypothetical protein
VFGFGGIRRAVVAALTGVLGVATWTAAPIPIADAAAPAPCAGSPSVGVDGGAVWTRQRLVTLRVTVPAGASELEIANTPDFGDAQSRPLSPSCTYGWQLPSGSSDPERNVYVRFTGATDPSAVVSTRVWLDQEEPVIVRADARWRNRRNGWVLTVRAVDLGSGLGLFWTSRRDGTVRRHYAGSDQVVTWDRSTIERVRYVDRLGNRTGWVRVRFLR